MLEKYGKKISTAVNYLKSKIIFKRWKQSWCIPVINQFQKFLQHFRNYECIKKVFSLIWEFWSRFINYWCISKIFDVSRIFQMHFTWKTLFSKFASPKLNKKKKEWQYPQGKSIAPPSNIFPLSQWEDDVNFVIFYPLLNFIRPL